MSRRRRLVAAVLAATLVLPGCGLFGDDGRIQATATFDDVADMADGAPVMMADVRIGNVTGIDLDDTGTRAHLELSVEESAGVPADVQGRVRRTSPLGEKFVELLPQTDDLDAPLLQDGDEVSDTEVVPDLEQLVAAGTDLFGALTASEIAILLDEGAAAFGNRGPQLRALFENLETIMTGFSSRTESIRLLITALDELAAATGPAAQAHADAIANLAQTTDILDENSTEFLDMIDALNRLAVEGNSIFNAHFDQMSRQLQALRSVTRAVAREQEALHRLFDYAVGHNEALRRGESGDFAQVLNDFIFCGLAGGGEVPGDPLNSCTNEVGGPSR